MAPFSARRSWDSRRGSRTCNPRGRFLKCKHCAARGHQFQHQQDEERPHPCYGQCDQEPEVAWGPHFQLHFINLLDRFVQAHAWILPEC
jgi:hypothetical protein